MSLNEPLDFKSQSKRKRSESERTAKKHAKNKRLKSKRAASPTSSYLSMRTDCSMDPPTNFKGGETFPLHSRVKRKRETSPVTGYISLKSENPMNVSKGIASDLRVRSASPTPTCLSLKTDWSIDPPTNFKAAETLPLDPRLLTEQQLRCHVCKLMLKDPVSIPCGHNYCNACINAFWDNCAGEYVCPHCGKASETRPVLNINAFLAEVVKYKQQTGFSPALPQQSYAGPEDVPCDFCFECKLKSVKSCLTCDVFLCETHVRQHYTIPALQKHTLSDVAGDIKTRPSEQNSDNSFSSTAGGQQHHADIKEMAFKLQTRLKRSAKTFRPKTKEKKDHVRKIELMCSTLQQEVSGLKETLSKLETKTTKKEKDEDEEDYGEEYDDDYGEEDDDDDEEEEDDYGEEDDDEDEEEDDYGEEDDDEDFGDDGDDNSEKDFDAETDEEEEGGEDSFDDEDGYKDDYDLEEDDWEENEDNEDYDDEDNSEEDSDEDHYDTDY